MGIDEKPVFGRRVLAGLLATDIVARHDVFCTPLGVNGARPPTAYGEGSYRVVLRHKLRKDINWRPESRPQYGCVASSASPACPSLSGT